MDILNLAATHSRIALQFILTNVADIEQLVQMQILAKSITKFCNSATAGLDSVLKQQLSPSLVPKPLSVRTLRNCSKQPSRFACCPSSRTITRSTS